MVKTPTQERLKKLIKMRNQANKMNLPKVSMKLTIRINKIYKSTKDKSILEWK